MSKTMKCCVWKSGVLDYRGELAAKTIGINGLSQVVSKHITIFVLVNVAKFRLQRQLLASEAVKQGS